MTADAPEGSRGVSEASAPARRRFILRDLRGPRDVISNLAPNWYASVMGTGIVATGAASLPVQFHGLRTGATVVWALAALLLVMLTAATVLHWIFYRETARGHHLNPVVMHFYGAPPLAFLTVAMGTLLLGRDWIGVSAAVRVAAVLWIIGTIMGLASAVAVPYLTFTRQEIRQDAAFGGWLLPVIPPMGSASAGALLLPYMPQGQLRATLLWGCYSLFGLSLVASLILIAVIWNRLAMHPPGPVVLVPTLWIVLGPIGQSITAVNLLAGNAGAVVGARTAHALLMFALVYGFAMLGFVLLWTALVLLATIRSIRRRLPFALTWWSFTFPVGTCVTGLNELTLHSGLIAVGVLAVVYYAGLIAAWIIVAVRTFHGSVIRGGLLAPSMTV